MLLHTLLCVVFFFLSCLLFPAAAASIWSHCNRQDISALLQFKDSFQLDCSIWYNSYPKTSSWNVKNLTAQWNGVYCHRTTGRVIGLDLSLSCLHGSINSTSPLFQLHHLERLNLAYNNFSFSKIPPTLGNLSRLTHLNLSNAHFVGEIPLEMSKLSKLSSLHLSLNSYYYYYPEELNDVLNVVDLKRLIQNLTNLEELDLTLLSIESNVPADDTFTNMSSLRSLKLGGCGLHGEFPLGIFYLPNLRMLDMRANSDLRGSLPDFHNSSNALESIQLGFTQFSGYIPSSIGNLASLRTLDLYDCGFFGSLPPQLGNLTQLIYISLSGNNFNSSMSSFPWLGHLTDLTFLDLSFNHLTGRIPQGLTNLTQLSELDLDNNQLFGEIPLGIMNLTQLTWLNLGFNKLQGPINPTSFSSLKNLIALELEHNHLSGELDLGIFFQFKDLEVLVLSSNNLTVLISGNNSSTKIEGARTLHMLGLSSCRLTKFPEFLRNQHRLEYLDLSDNAIKGPIPKLICALPLLYVLDLSSNHLTGEISPWRCTSPFLHVLDLSSNHLSGQLTDWIGNLQVFNLRNNNFGGRIPQLCAANDGMGKTLEMIDLNGNNLEGKLPRSLSNCTELEFLDLENNLIHDDFPSWLGSLQHLSIIILNANLLHGPALGMSGSSSDHQLQFPKLRIIDLSHNNISGELPANFFQQLSAMKRPNLTNTQYMGHNTVSQFFPADYYYSVTLNNKGMQLEYSNILDSLIAIDLSGNSFQGKIPVTLWSLRGLRSLNLSRNHLTGSIPAAIENLRQLESLDLSFNMFSERIPPQLKQLTFLSYFNVSLNNLTGQIPSGGQMDIFQNSSYIGNSGLCGPPLSSKCESSNQPKPQPPEKMAKKHDKFWKDFNGKLGWLVVFIGFGGGLVVGVAVEDILDMSEPIMLFWRRRRTRRRRQPRRNNN